MLFPSQKASERGTETIEVGISRCRGGRKYKRRVYRIGVRATPINPSPPSRAGTMGCLERLHGGSEGLEGVGWADGYGLYAYRRIY